MKHLILKREMHSLEDLALRKLLQRFLTTVGFQISHKKNEELYDFLEPVRLQLLRTKKFSLAQTFIKELKFERENNFCLAREKRNWVHGHFFEYWLWYYFSHIQSTELDFPDLLRCGYYLEKVSN